MRLRTFTGRTTAETMALVRAQLGDDAVIVSTQEDGAGSMRITAAGEAATTPEQAEAAPDLDALLDRSLSFHGLAPELSERIRQASLPFAAASAATALAGGLAAIYRFQPLQSINARAVILVGPAGSGKTATAAKLAARAVLAGERLRLVTTDVTRAGGIAQLAAFARILDAPFQAVDGPSRLTASLQAADSGERIVVDTGGVNPFSPGDRHELAALIGASAAEPVLVFAAGGDTAETIDMAQTFRALGCARVIVTRLDAAQRLGSVLAAADALDLGLAEAGIAPDIADGIVAFTPALLSRLLLPKGAP